MTGRGTHRQDMYSSTSPRATVAVLGPTIVTVDGVERTITARRRRAVLICLALHPDEPLSADRLLDEIWGEDLPDTGQRAVAHQVAKLRTLLQPDRRGEGNLITTTDAGYALHIAPDDVDAIAFERLVQEARAALGSDPARSDRLVSEALASWRGRPFADLDDEPFVDRAARRLEHHHLLARRTLAEARIAQGRHTEMIGELELLVTDHPLEESLVHLLMTALRRSGRAPDALRVYADLRRQLSSELGIEPSRELQQLEQQLLTDDAGPPTLAGRPDTRPRGVPAPLTTFVGRTEELAQIQDLLATTRLVTLVGFGGLGKTRLAQETARAVGDRFRNGVWYVDLTPIADPAVLADTIIAAGGLTVPPGCDSVEHLVVRLLDREVLLVLDNCEHLADDVAELVASIMRTDPDVRVLATSRVTLGVTGEASWTVRQLDDGAARELFLDRAQIARPGFALDASNRDELERLLDRLDGIPLAIEMAAARLSVLSIGQIAGHLGDRFELLTDTRRERNHRQQSLVAVMDWSYQLLNERDRELLRRMSVCVDGFDLDAAMHIGTPDPAARPIPEVFDGLGQLVSASLVILESSDHTNRYRMLEPIRQYASGRLDPDERDHVAHAHLAHYASVASAIYHLEDSDHHAAKRTAEGELGNLRAAMSWAYLHGDPRLGLSIARNAGSYFFVQQMYREVLGWLRAGLDLVPIDDDDTLAAAALAVFAAANLDDVEAHEAAFQRLEGRSDSVHDPRLRAELLSARASSALYTDPRAAEGFRRAALALRASVPHRTLALLNNCIDVSWFSGRLDDGPMILQRYEEVAHAIPADPTKFKITAGVAACDGRWDDVVAICTGAVDLDPMLDASVCTLHAEALGVLGRHDEALALLSTLEPDSFEKRRFFVDLVNAAIDLRRREPEAAAERLMVLADRIARDGRRLAVGMHVASLLAVAAHDLGQHETAAVLFGYAVAEQERLDIVLRLSNRPLEERALAEGRAALGDDRFEELAAQGADTPWRDLPQPVTSAT